MGDSFGHGLTASARIVCHTHDSEVLVVPSEAYDEVMGCKVGGDIEEVLEVFQKRSVAWQLATKWDWACRPAVSAGRAVLLGFLRRARLSALFTATSAVIDRPACVRVLQALGPHPC